MTGVGSMTNATTLGVGSASSSLASTSELSLATADGGGFGRFFIILPSVEGGIF